MGFKIALAQWVVLDASCGERQGSDLLFIHPHLNNKPPQAQKQPPEIQALLYLHVFTNILPPKGSGTGKVARMKGKSKKNIKTKPEPFINLFTSAHSCSGCRCLTVPKIPMERERQGQAVTHSTVLQVLQDGQTQLGFFSSKATSLISQQLIN